MPDLKVVSARPVSVSSSGKIKSRKRRPNPLGLGSVIGPAYSAVAGDEKKRARAAKRKAAKKRKTKNPAQRYEAQLYDGSMDAGGTTIGAKNFPEALAKAQKWARAGDWHTAGLVTLELNREDGESRRYRIRVSPKKRSNKSRATKKRVNKRPKKRTTAKGKVKKRTANRKPAKRKSNTKRRGNPVRYVLMHNGDVWAYYKTLAQAKGAMEALKRGQPQKRDSFGNLLRQTASEKPIGGNWRIDEIENPKANRKPKKRKSTKKKSSAKRRK